MRGIEPVVKEGQKEGEILTIEIGMLLSALSSTLDSIALSFYCNLLSSTFDIVHCPLVKCLSGLLCDEEEKGKTLTENWKKPQIFAVSVM
ncbi:hypothetical protein L484_007127 [Morus notabilis]|uniref:Uncharacterized protein n=1 Tax=Morus notabilis TaxID=981085 RepID=W9S4J0_9ROSA|nr:hypothetical protein L484_007127 [Morus notabilis]